MALKTKLRTGVAFMHIPKSGGMSITKAMIDSAESPLVFNGLDRVLFGNFSKFDSFSPPIRSQLVLGINDLPKDAELVVGHMAMSTLEAAYPKHELITVVREPKIRLISLWLYLRTFSEGDLLNWGEYSDYQKLARRSLCEFLSLSALSPQTDNLLVRMLLWPNYFIPESDFIPTSCDEYLLSACRDRLKKFALVDVLEFGGFGKGLSKIYGKNVAIERINETITIPHDLRPRLSQELTYDAIKFIEQRTRLDKVLWEELVRQINPEIDLMLFTQSLWSQAISRYIENRVASLDA